MTENQIAGSALLGFCLFNGEELFLEHPDFEITSISFPFVRKDGEVVVFVLHGKNGNALTVTIPFESFQAFYDQIDQLYRSAKFQRMVSAFNGPSPLDHDYRPVLESMLVEDASILRNDTQSMVQLRINTAEKRELLLIFDKAQFTSLYDYAQISETDPSASDDVLH